MLGGLAEPVGDSALPGDRQTDQIIEGLDQIHRALLALVLLGNFHSVGEGIGERLHVQQAAAALQIHHVVNQVILAQQRLELSAVVGKLNVRQRIFVALKAHVFDNLRYSGISVLRFAIFPCFCIDCIRCLFYTEHRCVFKILSHLYKNVLAATTISEITIHYCMSSGS